MLKDLHLVNCYRHDIYDEVDVDSDALVDADNDELTDWLTLVETD